MTMNINDIKTGVLAFLLLTVLLWIVLCRPSDKPAPAPPVETTEGGAE